MATAYIYAGDTIAIPIRFLEGGTTPADPSTLTLTLTDTDGTATVYTYGVGSVIEQTSTGNYTATVRPETAGAWSYVWEYAADGGTDTSSGSLNVRSGYVDLQGGSVATFEGDNRPALITTSEIQPTPLKQTLVDELWPEIDVDSSDVTGFVITRSRRSSFLTWGGSNLTWGGDPLIFGVKGAGRIESDLNNFGFCPVRLSARYMQMGIDVAAGLAWTEATGMAWRGSAGGER